MEEISGSTSHQVEISEESINITVSFEVGCLTRCVCSHEPNELPITCQGGWGLSLSITLDLIVNMINLLCVVYCSNQTSVHNTPTILM